MLTRSQRYVAIFAFAGALLATAALADSKGSGSADSAAYAQCIGTAVQAYNIALEQCPPPGTYGRASCETSANIDLANAESRCAGGAAALRGGSSAIQGGSGTMHGTYGGGSNNAHSNGTRGGYNGDDSTRNSQSAGPPGSRHPGGHSGQFPNNGTSDSH